MTSVVVKLFRSPQDAAKALKELQAKGYGPEVGVLLGEKVDRKQLAKLVSAAQEGELPEVGKVAGLGAIAPALGKGKDTSAALAELWGVPEDASRYYQFGVSMGGVVVSVHGEEARLADARNVLRLAAGLPSASPLNVSSPGFAGASRMSGTDPIDAKMSGDFRRY